MVGLFKVTALLKSIAVFHCLYCSPNKAITISAFCIKTLVRKLLISEAASSLYTCSGCLPKIASPYHRNVHCWFEGQQIINLSSLYSLSLLILLSNSNEFLLLNKRLISS